MTMATNMSEVEFADAIPIWANVSTLSAKSWRHKVQLPVENRLGSGDFDPTSNKIKVTTMKVSKGLEFPVVALPAAGEDEKEAARVFYVAATRATQWLVTSALREISQSKQLEIFSCAARYMNWALLLSRAEPLTITI